MITALIALILKSMHRFFLLTICIFVSTLSFSQNRRMYVAKDVDGDTVYTYADNLNRVKTLGLLDLRNEYDSINFRFWSTAQVLDFRITKSNQLICDQFFFINKRGKNGEREYVIKKYSISNDSATLLWKKVKALDLMNIKYESAIKGWGQGKDGQSYDIEYSNKSRYKYSSYWEPGVQSKAIIEAKRLQDFITYANSFLNTRRRFRYFLEGLEKGNYSYGMVIISEE